jgi:hypothetical protein
MNQLEPLGTGEYAISRISGEYVFFNPKLSLNPSAVEMATSLEAQGDSELNHETPVLIKELTIKGAKYRAFLASTRSNQLSLKLYDETGKKVAGTPYGELLILTQVRVMGSYNRIGTIKLSKANLESLVTPE